MPTPKKPKTPKTAKTGRGAEALVPAKPRTPAKRKTEALTLPGGAGEFAPPVPVVPWNDVRLDALESLEMVHLAGYVLDVETTGLRVPFVQWVYDEGMKLRAQIDRGQTFFKNLRPEQQAVLKRAERMEPLCPWGDEVVQLTIRYGYTGEIVYSEFFEPEVEFTPKAQEMAHASGVLEALQQGRGKKWPDEIPRLAEQFYAAHIGAWNGEFDRYAIAFTNQRYGITKAKVPALWIQGDPVTNRARVTGHREFQRNAQGVDEVTGKKAKGPLFTVIERDGPGPKGDPFRFAALEWHGNPLCYIGQRWTDLMEVYGRLRPGKGLFIKQEAAAEAENIKYPEGMAHNAEADTFVLCNIAASLYFDFKGKLVPEFAPFDPAAAPRRPRGPELLEAGDRVRILADDPRHGREARVLALDPPSRWVRVEVLLAEGFTGPLEQRAYNYAEVHTL